MKVRLGPFPSEAARAWLQYARSALALVDGLADDLPFQVPPEVVADFEFFLDAWQQAAETEPFVWESELDAFQVRHLMTYWLNVANVLSERVDLAGQQMPEVAGPFYEMLVDVILQALAKEDQSGERMQKAWPFRT